MTIEEKVVIAADDATKYAKSAVIGSLDGDGKFVPASASAPFPIGSSSSVTTTATIANAASLSGVVDCGSARLALIVMPASWTAADLTFQESVDGSTFVDKYDSVGVEYTVVCGGASRSLTINLSDFIGARYLKIRSGTSAVPVAQGGSRVLTLVLVP